MKILNFTGYQKYTDLFIKQSRIEIMYLLLLLTKRLSVGSNSRERLLISPALGGIWTKGEKHWSGQSLQLLYERHFLLTKVALSVLALKTLELNMWWRWVNEPRGLTRLLDCTMSKRVATWQCIWIKAISQLSVIFCDNDEIITELIKDNWPCRVSCETTAYETRARGICTLSPLAPY